MFVLSYRHRLVLFFIGSLLLLGIVVAWLVVRCDRRGTAFTEKNNYSKLVSDGSVFNPDRKIAYSLDSRLTSFLINAQEADAYIAIARQYHWDKMPPNLKPCHFAVAVTRNGTQYAVEWVVFHGDTEARRGRSSLSAQDYMAVRVRYEAWVSKENTGQKNRTPPPYAITIFSNIGMYELQHHTYHPLSYELNELILFIADKTKMGIGLVSENGHREVFLPEEVLFQGGKAQNSP